MLTSICTFLVVNHVTLSSSIAMAGTKRKTAALHQTQSLTSSASKLVAVKSYVPTVRYPEGSAPEHREMAHSLVLLHMAQADVFPSNVRPHCGSLKQVACDHDACLLLGSCRHYN